MTDRRYAVSEAAGAAAIYGAAVFLHFVCAMTDNSALAVLFGAVNESVWEHVKIFSVAYCGYAILQLLWIRVSFRRYVVGKCCGLYLLMAGIIAVYYLYSGLCGGSVLWVEVTYPAILVAAAQLCSYLIVLHWRKAGEFFAPALLLIMLYYLMFFCFSVFPPRAELFRDPVTDGYGLDRV